MTVDAISYCRVSTDEQTKNDRTSLAQQDEAIAALATRLGRTIGKTFQDPGASGGTAEGRPGFMALINFCRDNIRPRSETGFVLVLNDARWGRFTDAEESAYWRVELRKHGWLVRFAEGDETQDPATRGIVRALHSGQATAYREAIKANAIRGARGSAGQGYWLNEAPFGFRRRARSADGRERTLDVGQRKSDDERVRLTPGPDDEVAFVREVFDLYLTGGRSLQSIAKDAQKRFSARRWSKQQIRRILINPAYVGDVIWCRRPHDRDEKRETPVRPESAWVTATNAHPPLVSRLVFAGAAKRLHLNQRQTRPVAGGYSLSGLLTCAHCGDAFAGGGGPKGPEGDLDRYRAYRHRVLSSQSPTRLEAANACPALFATLTKRTIEPAVMDALAKVVGGPAVRAALTKAIGKRIAEANVSPTKQRAQLERRRAELATQRDRLVNLAATGALSDDEVRNRVATIRAEIEEVTSALQQARFSERRSTENDNLAVKLLALASDFRQALRGASGLEQRELLRPWLASAMVDRLANRLTLSIRTIPETFMLTALQPGRALPQQEPVQGETIVRTVPLPCPKGEAGRRLASARRAL